MDGGNTMPGRLDRLLKQESGTPTTREGRLTA